MRYRRWSSACSCISGVWLTTAAKLHSPWGSQRKKLNAEVGTHITMYAMADRYDIHTLAVAAKSKECRLSPDFLISRKRYSLVHQLRRGLKDIVLKLCINHATEITTSSPARIWPERLPALYGLVRPKVRRIWGGLESSTQ